MTSICAVCHEPFPHQPSRVRVTCSMECRAALQAQRHRNAPVTAVEDRRGRVRFVIPAARQCQRCRERWAQAGKYCLQCHRALGDQRTVRAMKTARLRPQPIIIDSTPQAPKYVIVQGQTYEVTFDGTRA